MSCSNYFVYPMHFGIIETVNSTQCTSIKKAIENMHNNMPKRSMSHRLSNGQIMIKD